MYFQKRQPKHHTHRYYVDSETGDAVCLCGKGAEKAQKRSKNKYHAKTCVYDGFNYDSIAEANYAMELDWRLKAREFERWERQVPIRIEVNGYHICTTKVDFLIHHKDGNKELVEVKGFETPDYRIKKKLIEAVFLYEHPEYGYTLVK